MGLHSMMNQDQYHASQSEKAPRADPDIGWQGITKSTPLKQFPPEAPNKTEAADVLAKLKANDPNTVTVNLNNVPVKEETMIQIFESLKGNSQLVELSLANTMMSDTAACVLADAIECNRTLEKVNLESNNISPQTMAKIFESINVLATIKEIKGSNQQAKFLGNKVEMAITKAWVFKVLD